jgi:hypothetical protein
MIKRQQRPVPEQVQGFIATARKYIGYQSESLGRNQFGAKVGYDTKPWDGAFIDVVARESGLRLPSLVYTPAALAEFIRNREVQTQPRPGDLVFFNFSTELDGFGPPHVGLVVDVRNFESTGEFLAIEGNVVGPTNYSQQDGVHQRLRHLTDVLIFARPAELQAWKLSTDELRTKLRKFFRIRGQVDSTELAASTLVKADAVKPGLRNKNIELVQIALGLVTDIEGAERGKWDIPTASAFARFQRNIGRVGQDADGLPDVPTLNRLGKETGLFELS